MASYFRSSGIFLAVLLFSPTESYPQHVDVTINGLDVGKAYLSAVTGEKVTQIDSVLSTVNGRFAFDMSHQNRRGFYRMSFDKNRWIDLVNDAEDIGMVTQANALFDSMHVLASRSNRLYYEFIRLNKEYKTKSDLLQLVLARYPRGDPYYRTTQLTMTQLQKEYSDFISTASQERPASFVSRYVRSSQLPVLGVNLQPEKQLAYLKAHALDNVDFSDEGLIYSDLFTNKSIEYLTYYRNPQLPKELLEKEFMVAADTILGKARMNLTVYQHIARYLIDGFRKFGFEKCIDYILGNYVIKDDLCLDERPGSSLQRMAEQKKTFPVGATVPNIVLPDTGGNLVSLAALNAQKVLILFYSSSCPHCQAMIPRLAEIYHSRTTFRVMAVSLDSSRSEWRNFVRANNLTWINVNDQKGWSGAVASDYLIYATPTMVLVDRDKKILAKPLTIDELVKWL